MSKESILGSQLYTPLSLFVNIYFPLNTTIYCGISCGRYTICSGVMSRYTIYGISYWQTTLYMV